MIKDKIKIKQVIKENKRKGNKGKKQGGILCRRVCVWIQQNKIGLSLSLKYRKVIQEGGVNVRTYGATYKSVAQGLQHPNLPRARGNEAQNSFSYVQTHAQNIFSPQLTWPENDISATPEFTTGGGRGSNLIIRTSFYLSHPLLSKSNLNSPYFLTKHPSQTNKHISPSFLKSKLNAIEEFEVGESNE